jgi:hypothetical protein
VSKRRRARFTKKTSRMRGKPARLVSVDEVSKFAARGEGSKCACGRRGTHSHGKGEVLCVAWWPTGSDRLSGDIERAQWCAVLGGVLDPRALDDETVCGHRVALRVGSEVREPTCVECRRRLGLTREIGEREGVSLKSGEQWCEVCEGLGVVYDNEGLGRLPFECSTCGGTGIVRKRATGGAQAGVRGSGEAGRGKGGSGTGTGSRGRSDGGMGGGGGAPGGALSGAWGARGASRGVSRAPIAAHATGTRACAPCSSCATGCEW